MVSHRLLFSQPGTGTINDLKKLALGSGHGFSYHNLSDQALSDGDGYGIGALPDFLSPMSIDEQLRRSPAVLMVIDGLEQFTQLSFYALVSQMELWTEQNPDLPITVYWTIFEPEAWRAREIAEELLRLVAV